MSFQLAPTATSGKGPGNGLSAPVRDELPDEWWSWLVKSLLADSPRQGVEDALIQGLGLNRSEARACCIRAHADPAVLAALQSLDALRKLESHLDALEQMRLLSPRTTGVARRRQVSPHEFFEGHYSVNLPLLIEDFASSWPALHRWTPERLCADLGDLQVEIMGSRDSDARYEQNFQHHREVVPFASFVHDVLNTEESNDRYMVANNELLKGDAFRPLLDDLDVPEGILGRDWRDGGVFFWFGPKGTVTPLHHDVENVLLVQIQGSKRVRLVSPFQSHRVYNEVSVYSEVDLREPDLVRHPRFAGVNQAEVVLRPGEALFIPVGWWHHVTSLDRAISASFIKFAYPNDFSWHFPLSRCVAADCQDSELTSPVGVFR